MTFWERLKSLMDEKHITAKQVTEELHISKNSFTYWKQNGNIPRGDILESLSNYFDCSTDYLLGKTDIKKRQSIKDETMIDKSLLFRNRFYNLCTEKGIKPNILCFKLEIPTDTITEWEKGYYPNTFYLIKIADYFNVTVDYLLGINDIQNQKSNIIEEIQNDSLSFWDRFYNLCLKVGSKPNPVCKELGFSNAVSSHWKAGQLPGATSLKKIANYFNVSTDYLLGKTDIKKEQTTELQSDNKDINKLIEIGTKLSPEHLQALLVLAEQLEKGQSEK